MQSGPEVMQFAYGARAKRKTNKWRLKQSITNILVFHNLEHQRSRILTASVTLCRFGNIPILNDFELARGDQQLSSLKKFKPFRR